MQNVIDYVTQYANDVIEGNILASEKNIKTCQRHLDDMNNKLLNYHFDVDRANHVINFLEMLPDPKSGKALGLAGFQKFIAGSLYGWVSDEGYRRFTKAYLSMSRKNGNLFCLVN